MYIRAAAPDAKTIDAIVNNHTYKMLVIYLKKIHILSKTIKY